MKLRITLFVLMIIALSFTAANAGLTKTEISQLYVSVFNRASEGEGNAYWQSQPDMATAATAMLDTDAAKNYFGANLNTNQAFIEHIYLNTLNKTIADDADGISYWVGMLDAGTSRGSVVATLVGVIKDYAPGGPYYNPYNAATIAAYWQFTNRVTVSDYMADTVYDTPANWATSTAFSSGLNVTDNLATVDTAKATVNSFNGTSGTYSISPSSGSFTSSGGASSVSVSASSTSCAWTTSESFDWVSLSSTSGSGSGAISVTVDANTGAARSVSIIIAGKTYTISQAEAVLGYLETWKGTFSGLDSGSWQVWIYTDGTIQGEAFSNDLESNLSVTGRYDFQGNFFMTATYGNTSAGAIFTGVINISTGVVSGNWVNNYYEEEYGTFSGNRQ